MSLVGMSGSNRSMWAIASRTTRNLAVEIVGFTC
jgi:hypothetical protein